MHERVDARVELGDRRDLVHEPHPPRLLRAEGLTGEEVAPRGAAPVFRKTKVEITAGTMPRRTSVKPNWVPSAATTMSQAARSPIPPPRAAPCTRAMTGGTARSMARNMAAMPVASRAFSSAE